MVANLITPSFRAGYISVFKATAMKQANGEMGRAKYSVRALFPPSTDLSALKAAAGQTAKEKWGDNIPKSCRSPFRKNAELDNPVPGIGDDWIVVTFSANDDRRPGLVDARNQDIINEDDVYSGAWYRAEVRPFAYDQAGNKGVSFGLQNLQKMKDDDPIGAGRVPASKVFEPVEAVPAGSSAGSVFD